MKHIRIISPSGVIEAEYITRAKDRLESWGYRVSIGAHAMGQYGRFSGTEEERLSDLNEAFSDASVDVILCSRGGYGLQEIVDRIELPLRPKSEWPLVVGFSDVTVLHALMSLHGVPSLHASMCKALATLPEEDMSLQHLRQALALGKEYWNPVVAGFMGRKVIGGNLSVLYGLQGTPYSLHAIIDQCTEAPVLLIEDISERHYHVDRMLNNLRLSGVFDRLGGVIVGQFTNCDDDPKMGTTLRGTIINILSRYDYPAIIDAPIGHVDDNYPIVLS